jgi:hypothetical protein
MMTVVALRRAAVRDVSFRFSTTLNTAASTFASTHHADCWRFSNQRLSPAIAAAAPALPTTGAECAVLSALPFHLKSIRKAEFRIRHRPVVRQGFEVKRKSRIRISEANSMTHCLFEGGSFDSCYYMMSGQDSL